MTSAGPDGRKEFPWRRSGSPLGILLIIAVIGGTVRVRRRSDMHEGFLPAFVARWTQLRGRYLADPEEHGVRNTRLVKLWKRFGGRCPLCGGHVPHPILELDQVGDDNAPTADHAKLRAEGGRRPEPPARPPLVQQPEGTTAAESGAPAAHPGGGGRQVRRGADPAVSSFRPFGVAAWNMASGRPRSEENSAAELTDELE
jgi:hypothetical protein